MKTSLLTIVFSLLYTSVVNIAHATEVDNTDPQKMVNQITSQMLASLREARANNNANPEAISRYIETIILPHMDATAMAKLVLGKYWSNASATQQEQFTLAFQNLLVRTYSNTLSKYSDQTIDFLPFQAGSQPDKFAEVKSLVQQPGGSPITLNYRLRYKPNDNWKVYDIVVEGVSMVTNYRSSFARKINSSGIDSLISELTERNAS